VPFALCLNGTSGNAPLGPSGEDTRGTVRLSAETRFYIERLAVRRKRTKMLARRGASVRDFYARHDGSFSADHDVCFSPERLRLFLPYFPLYHR